MKLSQVSNQMKAFGCAHVLVTAKPNITVEQHKWLGDSIGLILYHGTQAPEFHRFAANSFFTDDYEVAWDRAHTRSQGPPRVMQVLCRNAEVLKYGGIKQYRVADPNDVLILKQNCEEPCG